MSYKDFQLLPSKIVEGIKNFEISIGVQHLAFLPDAM